MGRKILSVALALAIAIGGYDVYLRATAAQLSAGGMMIPARVDESITSVNNNTYVLDLAGKQAAMVFTVPKSGDIEAFEVYVTTVGNAPDNAVRFSFQNVDASTGLPDGVDESVTVAGASVTVGHLAPGDFSANRTVVKGEVIAAVVDTPNFTTSDSFTLGGQVQTTSSQIPYGISATSTKQQTTLPLFVLRYSDGSYVAISQELWQVTSYAGRTFQSDTTPDEFGLKFEVPFDATLVKVDIHGRFNFASNSADLVVYDGSNNVMSTQTIDGDIAYAVTGVRYYVLYLDDSVAINAGDVYRVVWKANSSTLNSEIYYGIFTSLAMMDSVEGGQLFVATQRTDAGSWTDFDNGGDGYWKPQIHLTFDTFDDGAGGSSTYTPGVIQ